MSFVVEELKKMSSSWHILQLHFSLAKAINLEISSNRDFTIATKYTTHI
jgi:hypothetical protein